MPALPADAATGWGNGSWAAEVDNRVRGNGTAATPTARTLGTGSAEAAAGNHTHSTTAASETVQGIVELATAAETTTGTDNTRAVHPAGLKVELDKKQSTTTTQTTQTGASYTFVAGDAGGLVEGNSATAQTFTVPPTTFSTGQSIVVRQYGAGQITIAPGAGMTGRAAGGAFKTFAQYAEAVITFRSATEYIVSGYTGT
jgi:hypothetical protein